MIDKKRRFSVAYDHYEHKRARKFMHAKIFEIFEMLEMA